MKRRDFIQAVGITSLLSGIDPRLIPMGQKGQILKNWAWLHGGGRNTDEELLSFLTKLKDNRIDGVLPSGGNEFYRRIAKLTKQVGLDLHTWRWTMNRSSYMRDRPDIYAISREGISVIEKPPYVGYYRWMCPSHPDVKKLLIQDYTELCEIDGVTAVHLDYVRYCDVILPIALQPKYNLVQDHEMAEFDYCYCERCRTQFKDLHGTDPLEMKDPSQNKDWHQFRLDLLVEVVNAVAGAVHKTGKQISAAVFPTPTIARKIVRQDWERFDLDAFFPMIYFKDYKGDLKWVEEVVKEDVRAINGKAKLYAGLHLGHVRQFGIKAVVDTCIHHGADGVCFFTGHGLKDDDWIEFTKTISELES